ncbi:hypothetical protein Ddye_019046 [Dipteronia dyeriana]|uniref:Uncharacterized protein n=1 Tax=Dipteronia dyeriana TaxID=168575 RepID=A0AAD9TXI7_9ROSI|nr:hypothetical protein Ddye_019046 [Dipteronia dyeriana]
MTSNQRDLDLEIPDLPTGGAIPTLRVPVSKLLNWVFVRSTAASPLSSIEDAKEFIASVEGPDVTEKLHRRCDGVQHFWRRFICDGF